jgi:hypothetical protein
MRIVFIEEVKQNRSAELRKVPCPTCGAKVGENCGAYEPRQRVRFHKAREEELAKSQEVK